MISNEELDRHFFTMLGRKNDFHYMITVAGQVIGHCALAQRKNGWYETQIVVGEKKNWGKGFGSKAIEQLLKRALRHGITKIYLEVRPTNKRAIKAYKKCGFQPSGIRRYPHNKFLPEVLKMKFAQAS